MLPFWREFWLCPARLDPVGPRPVVRLIAARGRLCAGAACLLSCSPALTARSSASHGLAADASGVARPPG
jgi:hypothetical protein